MRALTLTPLNSPTAFSSFSERLAFAKQRVDSLESHRITQVLNHCDPAFHQVFTQLALLLHYNSPNLPAYVENAPQGITYFEHTQYQDTISKLNLSEPKLPAFDGVYTMGSIGSMTQTTISDLDVWVCHSRDFSEMEMHQIHQKFALIQQWASDLGVEVSLFLMNPQAFQAQTYHRDAGDEHNGSAQHFFLLDEFYRSAIRLAGKRILWLHIDKQGQNYRQLIEQAVENGELNTNDWIDFGDFSSLSIGEFFGASLWQLYKGITSPYKSIIKILLLESYAQTYPKTDLISKKFKKLLLSPQGICYHFDPYLAMLEQVTKYLEQRQEFDRLDCLRRCFYIKARDRQNDPCRLKALAQLSQDWGWSDKEKAVLNSRSEWKVKQVVGYQQRIVDQLLQSYRHLLNFARKFQIDPSIMPHDADFLMRQLYSAFEDVPGKIQLLRHYVYDANSLAETDLTFIEVSEGVSVKAGWYMTNHAPFCSYDSNTRYVHYNKSLIKLIAWAYFNGLISAETRVHLVNQRINLNNLRQFITDLRLSFPLDAPVVGKEELHHPNEVRNLIVAVNLVEDPTVSMSLLNKSEIAQRDLFNLSASGQGIIGSVSIIYRNMWNEVITQHFEGNNSLLKSLKFISNKIYRSVERTESVTVFGYSSQLNSEIEQFVQNVVDRCISVKTGAIFQRTQPQFIEMAGKKWHLVFNNNQELKEIVAEIDENSPQIVVPNVVYEFGSEGFLQFFFDDNSDGSFHVYVLDKQNKMECYPHCQGQKEDKIKEISRVYAQDHSESIHEPFGSFNFPQFYQLLRAADGIRIVPFRSQQHQAFLSPTD